MGAPYQLHIALPPSVQRSLLTMVQQSYPHEAWTVPPTPPLTIQFFRELTEEELADVEMLLSSWGPFTVSVLGTLSPTKTPEGLWIRFPVESQDCIYMTHILSRFLDTVPQYATQYLPYCRVGMLPTHLGLALADPHYRPYPVHVSFLEVRDVIGKTVMTIPLHISSLT